MTRFLALLLLVGLAACTADTDAPADTGETTSISETPDTGAEMGEASILIGDEFSDDGEIIPVATAIERADDLNGETVAVEGTISKVCQMKGCWLTLASETGETFRIVVPKDEAGEYVFTFPMDAAGATAQVVGELAVETEDVETLQHLAEDEGQTPEQVAAITEPRKALVLTAQGARLSRA
ncbi:MAG: DUF4920 domain-containing protein [Bacteroidota bacterium]